MENSFCSNVASAPTIHSEKDGGTCGTKQPLSFNSAEDIWADFDCAIEMGHQLRRNDRMRELNTAYIARGPSPILDDYKTGTEARDEGKAPQYQANPTGDTIFSEFHKLQATKEKEMPAKPQLVVFTNRWFEDQSKESNHSLNVTQEETSKDSPNICDISCSVDSKDIYTAGTNDDQAEMPNSSEASEKSLNPDYIQCYSNASLAEQDTSFLSLEKQDEKKAILKPSYLQLPTAISLDRQEKYVNTETSLNQLLINQTDSRINVPVNTPVESLSTFQTSITCGYSPRESHSTVLATNNDWYTSVMEHVRDANSLDHVTNTSIMEDDANEELEEMFKRRVFQDEDLFGVCLEQEKLFGSEITLFRPETEPVAKPECNMSRIVEVLSPRVNSHRFSEISSSDSEDDSSRFIRKLTASSNEDTSGSTVKDQSHFTDRRNVELEVSQENQASEYLSKKSMVEQAYYQARISQHQPGFAWRVERRNSHIDQGLSKKSGTSCKPLRNIIVVKPINPPDAESLPLDKSQSDDASSVFSQSVRSGVSNHSQQGHSLRKRIRQALGKAARRIRCVFRMCR